MWETFIIHAMLGVIQIVLKNPQKQAEYKAILLEVRDTINSLYPNGEKQP